MKKILLIIILNIYTFILYGQNDIYTTKIEKPYNDIYGWNIGIATGFSFSNYIDFATSPLNYNGNPFNFSLAFIYHEEDLEFEMISSGLIGYFADQYHMGENQSDVKIVNWELSYLQKINKFNVQKLKLYVGGDFKFTYNDRVNHTLQNNSWGYEIIPTLFASSKLVWDISRTQPKKGRFLFLSYYLKPRKRDLSFRLNIGIINASYRNHYIYTDADSFTTNNYNMWDKYVFKVFSGFRAGTETAYSIYLSNGNSIKFSYIWDAYKTGGDLDKLEMAHHIFNITLLYKID